MSQPTKNVNQIALVKGKICFTNSDNKEGGLDNSDEDYSSGRRYKVIEGKKYKGQEPVLWFITGEEGRFSISVNPGNYIIVEDERPEKFKDFRKQFSGNRKKKYLKKLWKKPLSRFTASIEKPIELEILIKQFSSGDLSYK